MWIIYSKHFFRKTWDERVIVFFLIVFCLCGNLHLFALCKENSKLMTLSIAILMWDNRCSVCFRPKHGVLVALWKWNFFSISGSAGGCFFFYFRCELFNAFLPLQHSPPTIPSSKLAWVSYFFYFSGGIHVSSFHGGVSIGFNLQHVQRFCPGRLLAKPVNPFLSGWRTTPKRRNDVWHLKETVLDVREEITSMGLTLIKGRWWIV